MTDVTGSSRVAPVAIATARYAPDIGGVERHVERLAQGLVARGVPVEVLTTDPSGRLPALAVRDGVTVRRFPTLRGDDIYFASPRLLRWLWGHGDRYVLVHAHGYHTLVPAAAATAAARHGLPLVITAHYHGTGHTPFRRVLHVPYRPIGSRVLRAADQVLANSEVERGRLERDMPGLDVRVIPPGVDVPSIPDEASERAAIRLPIGRDDVTLLSVGRLEAYKQVDRIVAALPFLPGNHLLTVVGQGPDAAAIPEAATRLAVADRVHLRGRVPADELAAWYAAADVFVAMSREEAFGLTILEAAAAGAPVVASDIPAHREVMAYAAAGRIRLVELGAEGRTLARAIEAAIGSGRTTDRSGLQLPTWEGLVDGVMATYEEVLGGPLI